VRKVIIVSLLVIGCAAVEPATTTDTTAVTTTSTSSTSTTSSTTITTAPSTTTTLPSPVFTSFIRDVDAERLAHSWTSDCPVAPDEVVEVELTHWGFDGQTHEGAIVVARSEGENIADTFEMLFDIGYPIESVIPIGDLPPGVEDDDPDYNNTSGLHCRRATGSSRWSDHARGLAIDINPLLNPFITPRTLWPANSERYLDRALGEPGMITAGDPVVEAFSAHGWHWGGYWESIKDYQHFSTTNR
jgi:hypothetical protein